MDKKSCENCIHYPVCKEPSKLAHSFKILHRMVTVHSFFAEQDAGILGLSLHQAVASICKHYNQP